MLLHSPIHLTLHITQESRHDGRRLLAEMFRKPWGSWARESTPVRALRYHIPPRANGRDKMGERKTRQKKKEKKEGDISLPCIMIADFHSCVAPARCGGGGERRTDQTDGRIGGNPRYPDGYRMPRLGIANMHHRAPAKVGVDSLATQRSRLP